MPLITSTWYDSLADSWELYFTDALGTEHVPAATAFAKSVLASHCSSEDAAARIDDYVQLQRKRIESKL